MLMPQGKAFQTLQNRLSSIDIPCIELGTNYSYVMSCLSIVIHRKVSRQQQKIERLFRHASSAFL
jgi:hypothetical protein